MDASSREGNARPRLDAVSVRQRARESSRGHHAHRRYKAAAHLPELWRGSSKESILAPSPGWPSTNPAAFDTALDRASEGTQPMLYAATRTTFSPNIAHGGVKVNVIPESAEVDIDIRTLPGDDGEGSARCSRCGRRSLERRRSRVRGSNPASDRRSILRLGRATRVTQRLIPTPRPCLSYRRRDRRALLPSKRRRVVRLRAAQRERFTFKEFAAMFHGRDERVDQESLRLCTELWERTAREFVG